MALDHEAADRQLKKTLSLQDLFFLSMGGIIGSGWLFAVLGADNIAGPAVIISWIIGGILTLFIALTYAEVAGMLPRSGAIVRYPHLTHGGFTGYLLGWSFFLSAVAVPTIEAEAVVQYAAPYIHGLTTLDKSINKQILTGGGMIFAAILIAIFFFLNYFGVRFFGTVNTVITWWKFVLPALTFVFLMFAFHGSNFTAGGGFFAQGVPAIFQAIAISGIVFSYLGFRQALDFGGEAKNPQRDVPIATIASVVAATILYTLLQVGFTGAINWHAAGIPVGDWARLAGSKFAAAPFASELRGSSLALLAAFAVLLQIDAYVSPGGTGLVYTGTTSRTLFGMSIDGYFPSLFTKVSRFGVPLPALIATVVIGWFFLLPLPSWYLLVGFISSATVLTYLTGGVGLAVFRRTAGELHRPFRLRAAALLAPVSFISAGLIVFWSGTATLTYVVGAVFIGLPLYAWFYAPSRLGVKKSVAYLTGLGFLIAFLITGYFGPFYLAGADFDHPGGLGFGPYIGLVIVEVAIFALIMRLFALDENRQEIGASLWFLGFLFAIYIVSYFSDFGPLPKGQHLAFPIGTIVAAVISLACYYWAVNLGFKTREITEIIGREMASEAGGIAETAGTVGPNPLGDGMLPHAPRPETAYGTGGTRPRPSGRSASSTMERPPEPESGPQAHA